MNAPYKFGIGMVLAMIVSFGVFVLRDHDPAVGYFVGLASGWILARWVRAERDARPS